MKRSPLTVIFITVFIDLVSFGIVIPLLPFYAQQFDASGTTIGLLLSVFSLMSFLFMPLWGRISDRYGRRPVLLVTIFCSVIGYIIFANAFALWLLFVARIMSGIGNANISVAQAYISDVTSAKERAKGMGLIGAAFGLGFVFGPLIGGVFSGEAFGAYRFAIPGWIAVGLSLINFFMAYFMLPESLAQTKQDEIKAHHLIDVRGLQRAIKKENLGLLMIFFFIVTIAFSSIYATFPLFIMEEPFRLTSSAMGWFFVEIGIVSVIIQGGLIGRLNHRVGEQRLISFGAIAMAIGFITFPLSAYLPIGGIVLLIISTALISMGSSCLAPTTMGLTSRLADVSEQGSILGIAQSFASLGRMIGPFIGGAAYDYAGHKSPYYFAFVLMAVAAVMAFILKSRDLKLDEAPVAMEPVAEV